jgi:hypothetical protein
MSFFKRTPTTMKTHSTRLVSLPNSGRSKAADDCRTPKASPLPTLSNRAPASWTAAALGRFWFALATAFVLIGALPSAHAAGPPEAMAYQGFLVDGNGNPLASSTPANYPVIFRLFAAPTGGASLWSEQQIVTVDKGNFSVILSEGTAVGGEPKPLLSTVLSTNGADRYIEISVTIGASSPPMLPRLRLLPMAYAFLATSANNLVSPTGVPVIKYANNRAEVAGDFFASGGILGNGAGLTGLTAAQIGAGTFADSRLSANVALRAGGNTFTGNQTINGSVGIGGAPVDALLDVEGPMHLNLNDLFLREGADRNHGLGWYGLGKPFAGVNVDGPVLYGFSGGGLGAKSGGDKVVLKWDANGRVGIGNPAPVRLLNIGSSVTPNSEGMIRLESRSGTDTANRTWDIGVPETDGTVLTGAGYSFVIDDIQLGTTPEFMVKWGTGNVGIGTTEPAAKLDVNGAIKASSVTADTVTATTFNGTFNGEKPPLTLTIAGNTAIWRDVLVDATALLGDADGGKFRILLRHHAAREVRTITYEFYAENDSANFAQATRYGWSISSYAEQRGFRLGSGTFNDRYDIAYAWDWFWMRNYRSAPTNGNVDGPAFGSGERYKFYLMVPPNVTATIIVYDR